MTGSVPIAGERESRVETCRCGDTIIADCTNATGATLEPKVSGIDR